VFVEKEDWMGGKKVVAAIGVLVGAGFLAGCCLLSGIPSLTFTYGPEPVVAGQTVVFLAHATGGTGPYTYAWNFGGVGAEVTHIFASEGDHEVAVTVTDSCGKTATRSVIVSVAGVNLTGTWVGAKLMGGRSYQLQLVLSHSGTTLTGTAIVDGISSPGTGSYTGHQFTFQYAIPGSGPIVLTGTYDPAADELDGTVTVGTVLTGTWSVTRQLPQ
jgi:PKD repeat protein